MGWWSETIMGGDTPLDFQSEFEDTFGDDESEMAISPDDAIAFINDTIAGYSIESDDNDINVLKQVTGLLVMERSGPFSDELRKVVLAGVDGELAGGCEEWDEPEARMATLREFADLVNAYPNEGADVTLPHQPGLMEIIAKNLD